jgi:hypothetical protein
LSHNASIFLLVSLTRSASSRTLAFLPVIVSANGTNCGNCRSLCTGTAKLVAYCMICPSRLTLQLMNSRAAFLCGAFSSIAICDTVMGTGSGQ